MKISSCAFKYPIEWNRCANLQNNCIQTTRSQLTQSNVAEVICTMLIELRWVLQLQNNIQTIKFMFKISLNFCFAISYLELNMYIHLITFIYNVFINSYIIYLKYHSGITCSTKP